jgi:hypothetical protein
LPAPIGRVFAVFAGQFAVPAHYFQGASFAPPCARAWQSIVILENLDFGEPP